MKNHEMAKIPKSDQSQNTIISELKSENPKLRLIFSTVALGMGLDARCIVRGIHCRPPTTLEKYIQEIGRAGRSDQSCTAVLQQ
jgi:ATP-dependent DNA helicase RecQ